MRIVGAIKVVIVILSLVAVSCNRPHTVNSSADHKAESKQINGKWYFARMDGAGIPFSEINFISDSLAIEDTLKVPYKIKDDSIHFYYDLGELVSKIILKQDTLLFQNADADEYYCLVPFEWKSDVTTEPIIGVWWERQDEPTAAMEISRGVIQYPDPMYSARASLRGNILESSDRNADRVDTIVMSSSDTLILNSKYGADTLYRGKD